MIGIGILTMLAQVQGGYAVAGAVSATFTVSLALLGPQVSRVVDRRGQGRVLVPAMGVSVAALGALLLSVWLDGPLWTYFVFAALAGFLPNISAMGRARWAGLYREPDRLDTAFSFESVVDELSFVIGPALSVALSTVLFPQAGPLIAGVLLLVGVVLFAAQRDTEPMVQPRQTGAGGSVLTGGVMPLFVLLLVAGGTIVGTIDVVSVAFATQRNTPAAAGIVLSLYAAGSAVGGLAFGAWKSGLSLRRLLVLTVAGTAVTTLPLLLVNGIALLAITMFVSGLFFAPTMIVVMRLIEQSVPAAQLTEGMTWAITGLAVGVALGAALAGRFIDQLGARGGVGVAIGAGLLALALAVLATTRIPAPAGLVRSHRGE
ncbi:MFS transporter [Pseudonocardiaceae bacterium YIM PH 21723]|nr:MFS transporter [Pseudonocardiaceae bacterium YIM PH 21723]